VKTAGSAIDMLFILTIAFVKGYLGLPELKELSAPGATESLLNGSMKSCST
jgi:hypothetical protein